MEMHTIVLLAASLLCLTGSAIARVMVRAPRAILEDPCGVLGGDGNPVETLPYNTTVINVLQTSKIVTDEGKSTKQKVQDNYLTTHLVEQLEGATFFNVDADLDFWTINSALNKPLQTLNDTYQLAYKLVVHVDYARNDGFLASSNDGSDVQLKQNLQTLESRLYTLICHTKIGILSQGGGNIDLPPPSSVIGDFFKSLSISSLLEYERLFVLLNDTMKIGSRFTNIYTVINKTFS